MKNKIIVLTGLITTLWCAHAQGQLCTEDFLFNTKFEHADNLGLPADWRTRGDYDNRGVTVENGALKVWVNEGGNHDGGGVLFLAQRFYDDVNVISTLGNDTMYLRAWVRSTAIDEPTDEELLAAYLKDDPDRDTTGTHFRHNFGSFGGFGLVVQEANRLQGPPWFEPVEWTPWYDHDGAAIDDWKAVNGKLVMQSDVSYLDFWVQLRSKSACTVWIDNIQVSSSPDFCGESFEKPDPVSTKWGASQAKKRNFSFRNHVIRLPGNSTYSLNIYTTNGRLSFTRSGQGNTIDLILLC